MVQGRSNHLAVKGVSFQVRAGEVYGIAGVQGNGQTELVEAITGLRKALEDKVSLLGRDVTNQSPRTLTQRGLAHVPEDRHKHGLILQFPVDLNLILETYYRAPSVYKSPGDEANRTEDKPADRNSSSTTADLVD